MANLLFRIPFASDNGSGNGIAAKTYLDAVSEEPEVTDALKKSIKQQEGKYSWFGQLRGGSTLTKSLDQAWKVWDAVSQLKSSTSSFILTIDRSMPRLKCQEQTSRRPSSSPRPMSGFLHDDKHDSGAIRQSVFQD